MSQGDSQTKLMKTLTNASNVKLSIEWSRQKIEDLLPRGMKFDRFQRTAIECVRRTPKLLKCTTDSFLKSLIKAAQVGLEIDGILGSGYIVPYGDEAQFLPGYKGYLALCRRSGEVARVSHGVVYEADEFDYVLGDEPFCRHKPLAYAAAEIQDEKIQFVYFIVKLTNGEKHINVWPVAKIRHHMQRFSKSWQYAERNKKDSTWHHHFSKMAVKTVILDTMTSGEIPIDTEIEELAIIDRNMDMGIGDHAGQDDDQPRHRTVKNQDDLADVLDGKVAPPNESQGSDPPELPPPSNERSRAAKPTVTSPPADEPYEFGDGSF